MRFFKKRRVTFGNLEGRPSLQLDREYLQKLKEEGFSNREIAQRLHCSEGTVRNRIKQKQRA